MVEGLQGLAWARRKRSGKGRDRAGDFLVQALSKAAKVPITIPESLIPHGSKYIRVRKHAADGRRGGDDRP